MSRLLVHSSIIRTLAVGIVLFLTLQEKPLAQQKLPRQKGLQVAQLSDSLTSYSQSSMFAFPNVGIKPLYYDGAALQRIDRLDKAENDPVLYQALKEYVRHFGIENFSKNLSFLWRLARLSEKYGPPGEAILLYRLALKHHMQGIDTQRLIKAYDSLETDRKELYVPLDYYYKLVDLRKEIDTLQPPRGVLINMGAAINSIREDYGPTMNRTDTLLLMTSKRNIRIVGGQRMVDEDVFFSTRHDSIWNAAKEFEAINTTYNEGSACLSPDGQWLFFARCDAPDSRGSCDLYAAQQGEDGAWQPPENLGGAINSTAWDSHPSLNHRGDTLFFSSNRIGGFGMSDIYYATQQADGSWGNVKNVGAIVNTRGNEVSPFFHHRFHVLYFGSDGQPLNFGGFDIYKSYRQNGQWSEPKNIGPLVNGAGSEYYFTIDSESKYLYYAKSEESDPRNLDLYSFPVPMEGQPEAISHLHGALKNPHGKEPMEGIVSVIDLDYGVEVAPKFLRPDGSFDFDLIDKRRYLLIIQGDKFYRFEEVFFMKGDMNIDRYAEPIENMVQFKSVEFENSSTEILPIMHEDLRKVANFLIDHPGMKLTVHGHTDSTGEEGDNLKLSQSRAKAIKDFIVSEFKVAPARIKWVGQGSSQPLVDETSEEARHINRRVEFEMYRDR